MCEELSCIIYDTKEAIYNYFEAIEEHIIAKYREQIHNGIKSIFKNKFFCERGHCKYIMEIYDLLYRMYNMPRQYKGTNLEPLENGWYQMVYDYMLKLQALCIDRKNVLVVHEQTQSFKKS